MGVGGSRRRAWRRRESAPRSACENRRPPGRAAELNYQENTVAKGSREGYSIDLSHTDSGKSGGGSEGWAANESDGKRGGGGEERNGIGEGAKREQIVR